MGSATAAWAGTVADEIKLGGSANPDLVPVLRGWAGPAVRIVMGCVTVVDDDRAGRASVRAPPSRPTSRSSRGLDPTLELRAGEEPPLERFAIFGTPEEVAARVVSLWEAGVIASSWERRRGERRSTVSG